jgi:hypothetical protein
LSLIENQTVALSTTFTATDPSGASISEYQFSQAAPADGQLKMNGTVEATGTLVSVLASQLSQATFTAGSAPGTDDLYVRAYDGHPVEQLASHHGNNARVMVRHWRKGCPPVALDYHAISMD